MDSPLSPGKKLGHYEILTLLGAGGMGEVYLAQDAKLNRRIALKVLPVECYQNNQRAARFLREAQAASALNHPNICTIYEINDEGNMPFISMEYVVGDTLFEKIKGRALDLRETLDIAVQVADALAEAHAHDIVHRDIKPANIIVTPRGQVKILDFGLAKKVRMENDAETQQSLSQAGLILGTAAYMSPEQARGITVDARTDLWSFGVVLYEMLSGEKPFSGATTTDLLAAILRSEPKGLRKFNDHVSANLERLVLQTLRKERTERYQTAKELFLDLHDLKKQMEASTVGQHKALEDRYSETKTERLKARTQNSIAVLPFANLSADAENEFFCDGLTEELLNGLTKIHNLKVAARTSAFFFKGKNAPVSEIGNTLGVNNILEGSVRKAGNRIRVSVQLVKSSDGYHLWSEQYDREMQDIFDVQDEITLAVS